MMNNTTNLMTSRQERLFNTALFVSRLGGIAGLLGIALTLVEVSRVTASIPAIEQALQVLPNLAIIIWFAGIYALQLPHPGKLGSIGVSATVTGIASIIVLNLLQKSAGADPGNWASTFLESPAIGVIFSAIAVLFVWGVLALGTTSLKAGKLPRGAVVLWMVGMMASLNTSWPPVPLVMIAGVVWSSIVMIRGTFVKNAIIDLGANAAVQTKEAAVSGSGRLIPLDSLRGLIMILMAIDHASFFVRRWHPFETWDQPLPDYPSLAALLTRLVTHPCAPGFFFLMGAGMILFAHSRRRLGWSEGKIAGHLALRGLLLIALEQLIVDVASIGQASPLDFSILSGLGAAMLLGILFLRVNGVVQAGTGIAIILLMQFIPGSMLGKDLGAFNVIRLLLLPGSVGSVFVLYAPIPWLGVALLGMAFARLILQKEDRAYQAAGVASAFCLALFPFVRLLGGFGNLRMPAGNTVIDFFNLVKYPPSLSFLLLSLGFDLGVLFLLSRISAKLATWGQPIVILGRAALYFFLAHWFVYGALGIIQGDLAKTYLAWITGLLLLYPVCKTFESFKHRMPVNSVWRML